jgi:hypothetical protein
MTDITQFPIPTEVLDPANYPEFVGATGAIGPTGPAGPTPENELVRQIYTASAGQTSFAITYSPGIVDVWLNGIKLLLGLEFTATSGVDVVLLEAASDGDNVEIVALNTFDVAAITFGLGDLNDVDLTTTPPANGDGFVYDNAAGKWVPGPAGGGMFKGDNGTVGSRSGDIFRINNKTLTEDVTIAATENASATGPLAVASGKTLTVASGGTLAVI